MALDMFLSPLVSLLVNKAADSLIQQFCQMLGMEENREKLHLKLLGIQAVIADAEKQGANNPFVEACLKKLHAAAFEAVDILDEFQYEALRRKAIRDQPDSSAKVVKSCFSRDNTILFRQKISGKLAKAMKKIDEIFVEMDKFNFVRHDPVPLIDRETQSAIMESEVLGRDSEREQIVNALLDQQRERDNISILPIIGMGGLGKTTLAQLVYNHEKVKKHFQLHLWVCVSTEFDINNIIKLIIKVAQKGIDVSTSSKEVLRQQLCELLDKKRYLLVLDDVWNEEERKWNELKTLLFSSASPGCVILVTTRSKVVASIMGTLKSHDLALLSDEDSWRLFEKRAFRAWTEEPPEEQITIGRTIVSKCGGLPLAIDVMGGLMGRNSDVYYWRTIENKVWESLTSSENTLSILKLSYNNLSTYAQQCFAFCAVFPQDYLIERDTLIQLWMANDFIPTDGTMDLKDRGLSIFNELCWRSFFQDVREVDTRYGSIVTCKMHDLMHDLATQVAGKKCSQSNPKTIQKEVQHLFTDSHETIHIQKEFPIVRTLLAADNVSFTTERYSHLPKSSCLRALKFYIDSLPKEIEYMKHLRFLDLSQSDSLCTLPEFINKLYNLQTLKLNGTEIRELPEGMRYMSNLRHLYLDGCSHLEYMPIGLGQLKYLQTLTKYVVNYEKGGSIGELQNLNLCGHLSLSGLEKIRNREEAESANLSAKSSLHSLQLEWHSKSTTQNNQATLEAFRPAVGLKFLNIIGNSGPSFSKWMKEYSIMENLKRLELEECNNYSELPHVWQLPLLENLSLSNMESLISIVCGTRKNVDRSEPLMAFPSLKYLRLHTLPNLEDWYESHSEMIIFANLNQLEIIQCPKLKTVYAPSLTRLEVKNCSGIQLRQISNLPMLSYLNIRADPPYPTEIDAFRPPKTLETMIIEGFENVKPLEEEGDQICQTNSLRHLEIINSPCFFCHGQTKLALGFWKYFAALEYLEIYRCNNLVYWPEEELRNLKCLKILWIIKCNKFIGTLPASSSLIPIPSREDSLSLPQLESLWIQSCPELLEIPNSGMSLERVVIYCCPKLSREWSANLTKLKRLSLFGCDNWTTLPDNMGNLPALEELRIGYCQIESFPKGLQQRLPSLRSLEINGCPALERCCRRGGEYWDLVKDIPKLRIGEEDEEEETTKRESILRRLLPACSKS